MKNLKKIATAFCTTALGMVMLTGCEGSELYSIGAPDWISDKADSIAAAKAAKVVTLIPTPEVLGAEDNSQDWWSVFTDDVQLEQGKTYQIPLTNYGGASNWNNFVMSMLYFALTTGAGVLATQAKRVQVTSTRVWSLTAATGAHGLKP